MTSSTRLPTVWPTRPMSHPVMTWLGGGPAGETGGGRRAAGAAKTLPRAPRVQDASKTLPVRQITPTYWATTVWPLLTTGPAPLIRGLVTSVVGGVPVVGILTTGALPVVAVTVGSVPPPSETWVPDAEAFAPNFVIMSTTKTSVSVPLTPAWELPALP